MLSVKIVGFEFCTIFNVGARSSLPDRVGRPFAIRLGIVSLEWTRARGGRQDASTPNLGGPLQMLSRSLSSASTLDCRPSDCDGYLAQIGYGDEGMRVQELTEMPCNTSRIGDGP